MDGGGHPKPNRLVQHYPLHWHAQEGYFLYFELFLLCSQKHMLINNTDALRSGATFFAFTNKVLIWFLIKFFNYV